MLFGISVSERSGEIIFCADFSVCFRFQIYKNDNIVKSFHLKLEKASPGCYVKEIVATRTINLHFQVAL